jgi:hypothetical protein
VNPVISAIQEEVIAAVSSPRSRSNSMSSSTLNTSQMFDQIQALEDKLSNSPKFALEMVLKLVYSRYGEDIMGYFQIAAGMHKLTDVGGEELEEEKKEEEDTNSLQEFFDSVANLRDSGHNLRDSGSDESIVQWTSSDYQSENEDQIDEDDDEEESIIEDDLNEEEEEVTEQEKKSAGASGVKLARFIRNLRREKKERASIARKTKSGKPMNPFKQKKHLSKRMNSKKQTSKFTSSESSIIGATLTTPTPLESKIQGEMDWTKLKDLFVTIEGTNTQRSNGQTLSTIVSWLNEWVNSLVEKKDSAKLHRIMVFLSDRGWISDKVRVSATSGRGGFLSSSNYKPLMVHACNLNLEVNWKNNFW